MIDYTLYNIDLFRKEFREENISFRWSKVNKKFEFLKWREYPNSPTGESCIVIAFFDLEIKSEPTIRSVGDRIFDLTCREYECICRVASQIWDRYKYLRKDTLDEYLKSIEDLED